MKIKEILEKSKTLTLEKGKSYLMLIDESAACAESVERITEAIEDKLDINILVATVDSLDNFRIFELEKSNEEKKSIQASPWTASDVLDAIDKDEARSRKRDKGRDDQENKSAEADPSAADGALGEDEQDEKPNTQRTGKRG